MSAVTELNWPEPLDPTRIARVVSLDNKVQYVSSAVEHHGWLMQRRYVGVGLARYERTPTQPGRLSAPLWKVFDRFRLQYYPVLNAVELARDTLPYALVADWAAAHHVGTFHHPVYAKYCLRWGNNPGLRQVAAIEEYERIAEAPSVYFSAQTEWPAGETLYLLESPLATDAPLLLDLQARAGLHALSPYRASDSPRFGTTDATRVRQVLAMHAWEWGWQQRQSVYQVQVCFPEATGQAPVTWSFATAATARLWYELLPTAAEGQASTSTHAHASLQHSQSLDNCFFNSQLSAQKWLPADWDGAEPLLTNTDLMAAAEAGVTGAELTALDRPPATLVPTLAGLLDAQGLPLRALAAQLGIRPATLHRRAEQPATWTVAELQRVAQRCHQPLPQLAALLAEELAIE